MNISRGGPRPRLRLSPRAAGARSSVRVDAKMKKGAPTAAKEFASGRVQMSLQTQDPPSQPQALPRASGGHLPGLSRDGCKFLLNLSGIVKWYAKWYGKPF